MTIAHARQMMAGLVLMLGLASQMPVQAQDAASVFNAIRHGVYEDRLRLTFDVLPEPDFALFTLADPDRLVVDLPALDWQIPEESFVGIPYIENVRHGLFRRDRARVVIGLTQPLSVDRAFTQPPRGSEPGRLVIDLSPTDRAAFDASAGWPEMARWFGDAPPLPHGARTGDLIVAIDPGHGGIDPGASAGRLKEKTIVLKFAKVLAGELQKRSGFAAYLIRSDDSFVPLSQRVARAHQAKANILLSIHADSVESGRADGVSIYTLSTKGTDDAAEALAARENRSDVIAGADLGGESDELTRLLVELAQRGTSDESAKLAAALMENMQGRVDMLRTRPMRQANFRVLKAPDIPSVLLELGFLDSAKDRKRLTDDAWLAATAEAVADGLETWRTRASKGFLTPR